MLIYQAQNKNDDHLLIQNAAVKTPISSKDRRWTFLLGNNFSFLVSTYATYMKQFIAFDDTLDKCFEHF